MWQLDGFAFTLDQCTPPRPSTERYAFRAGSSIAVRPVRHTQYTAVFPSDSFFYASIQHPIRWKGPGIGRAFGTVYRMVERLPLRRVVMRVVCLGGCRRSATSVGGLIR